MGAGASEHERCQEIFFIIGRIAVLRNRDFGEALFPFLCYCVCHEIITGFGLKVKSAGKGGSEISSNKIPPDPFQNNPPTISGTPSLSATLKEEFLKIAAGLAPRDTALHLPHSNYTQVGNTETRLTTDYLL